MSSTSAATAERRPALMFLRHLGGMVGAMFAGMVVFGVVLEAVAAGAGSGLDDVRLLHPELFMAGMGGAMTVTMVAWMRRLGHGWRGCWEMTVAMLAPVPVVLAFHWAGALAADPICPLSCAAMIPAMAAAMLFRRGAYAHAPARGA